MSSCFHFRETVQLNQAAALRINLNTNLRLSLTHNTTEAISVQKNHCLIVNGAVPKAVFRRDMFTTAICNTTPSKTAPNNHGLTKM